MKRQSQYDAYLAAASRFMKDPTPHDPGLRLCVMSAYEDAEYKSSIQEFKRVLKDRHPVTLEKLDAE